VNVKFRCHCGTSQVFNGMMADNPRATQIRPHLCEVTNVEKSPLPLSGRIWLRFEFLSALELLMSEADPQVQS
jgi:hypothetical protein